MENLRDQLKNTRKAARVIAALSDLDKNNALLRVADELANHQEDILAANQVEVEQAITSGMSAVMVDRLTLTEKRWQDVINDLRKVVDLLDPVGRVIEEKHLTNGLHIKKQRVPLGVIAVIYEARPNVTVDVIGLAIKSGNGIVLRGGKETIRTNKAILDAIRAGLRSTAVPTEGVLFIDDPDRELLLDMMKQYDLIDMLIPRGGAGLHQFCREHSMIPVITGGMGICHLFVDESADQLKAIEVIRNAKTQRPTVCNALDTVLVHQAIAPSLIPLLIIELSRQNVQFHLDEASQKIQPPAVGIYPAEAQDFDREWLSLDLGIKVVPGLEAAMQHITDHSTGHSDGIITENPDNADEFVKRVDSAAVYVNASTRFTDGSALGLGAEIAISTQKMHARGPMALEELTTYKWIIRGDYHTRP